MPNIDVANPPPPEQPVGGQNALLSSQVQQGGPQQPMPRVPTHAETVATLRHTAAIRVELMSLAKDPALGKSNVKPAVIDGVLRLVADQVMTTVQAVDQLSKFPDEPGQQLQWVKTMLAQNQQVANGVLDHHASGTPGTLDWSIESRHTAYDRDNHLSTMHRLAENYSPKKPKA